MLVKYWNINRICTIVGSNLQKANKCGLASYFFSQFGNVWGWARRKRFWKKDDLALTCYSEEGVTIQLWKIFSESFLKQVWIAIFKK